MLQMPTGINSRKTRGALSQIPTHRAGARVESFKGPAR